MEWDLAEKKILSFSVLEVRAAFVGNDILIAVMGGAAPHIGCCVQAVPRPSLTGDGSVSVTSSVLNLTGHKDEILCRRVAERICREKNVMVVCSGGFHMDGIKKEQIEEVIKAAEELTDRLLHKITFT